MTEPRRLLEEGSPFERVLVSSYASEQPSAAARLATLSVGAAVAAEGAMLTAATTKPAAAVTAKTTGALATTKLLTVGVAIAVAAGGAVMLARANRTTERDAPAAASSQGTDRRPVAAAAEKVSEGGAVPVFTPESLPITPGSLPDAPSRLPTAASQRIAPSVETASPSPDESARASSVAREVAALDTARRALAAGRPRAVLVELDAYDAAFPNGMLVEEASALRIEALVEAGERATAQSAADRFHVRWPASPHAKRLRAFGLTIP